MYKILILAICLLSGMNLFAQETKEATYQEQPVWIQMMEDPNANYFEAVKAFNLYWEGREKPLEENELFSASQEEKGNDNFITTHRSEKKELTSDLTFAYKKFKHWEIIHASLIHEDGTLLTAEERIARWQQQQLNRH